MFKQISLHFVIRCKFNVITIAAMTYYHQLFLYIFARRVNRKEEKETELLLNVTILGNFMVDHYIFQLTFIKSIQTHTHIHVYVHTYANSYTYL